MHEQAFDIIGDIHGYAEALHRLFRTLGYGERDGVVVHPGGRKAVFVGDFIDRGPDQREVLRVVRAMINAGTALATMGNHEFNALGWATPDGQGGFLRSHSERNRHQHEEFLRQFGENSFDHGDALKFFLSLPLWPELPGIRVVHACWHEPARATLQPLLDGGGCLTPAGHGSGPALLADMLCKCPAYSNIYHGEVTGRSDTPTLDVGADLFGDPGGKMGVFAPTISTATGRIRSAACRSSCRIPIRSAEIPIRSPRSRFPHAKRHVVAELPGMGARV